MLMIIWSKNWSGYSDGYNEILKFCLTDVKILGVLLLIDVDYSSSTKGTVTKLSHAKTRISEFILLGESEQVSLNE